MELEEGKLYYAEGEGFGVRCVKYNGVVYRVRYEIRGESEFSNRVHGRLIRFDKEIKEKRELVGDGVSEAERRILHALRDGNLSQRRVEVVVLD